MYESGWLAQEQEQPSLGVETSPRLSLLLFAPAFVSGTSPASKAMLQANQVCQKRTEEAGVQIRAPSAEPMAQIQNIHHPKCDNYLLWEEHIIRMIS